MEVVADPGIGRPSLSFAKTDLESKTRSANRAHEHEREGGVSLSEGFSTRTWNGRTRPVMVVVVVIRGSVGTIS